MKVGRMQRNAAGISITYVSAVDALSTASGRRWATADSGVGMQVDWKWLASWSFGLLQ